MLGPRTAIVALICVALVPILVGRPGGGGVRKSLRWRLPDKNVKEPSGESMTSTAHVDETDHAEPTARAVTASSVSLLYSTSLERPCVHTQADVDINTSFTR